jgi:hypothetical protein
MKTGKINVGFNETSGTTRRLSVREQLIRNKQFVGINEINHPIHGKITIPRDRIDDLLNYQEGHLIRFKKSRLTDEV